MAVVDASPLPRSASEVATRRAVQVVSGGTILAFLLLAFMPARLAAYPHDALIQLEGAWRLAQGQRIHTGMHTPMGALYPLLLELGVRIFGPQPHAFLVPALLPLPFVAAAAWFVFSSRFSTTAATLLSLMLVAVLVGPTCLGDPVQFGENWLRTTFGMQYNRIFWPFATLLAAVCLVPRRMAPSKKDTWHDGLLVGACLGLCFFGKVNFFVAGLPIVAVALWREKDRRTWVKGFAISLVAVFVVFLLLGVPLRAYLGDLSLLSRAQSPIDRLRQIGLLMAVNVESVLGICAIVAALRDRRRTWLPIAALLLLVYGIIVTSANYQERAIPPFVLALFVLAEHAHRDGRSSSDLRRLADYVATSVAGGWIAATLLAFAAPYGTLFAEARGIENVAANAYSPFYRASFVEKKTAAEELVRLTDRQAKKCDELFGRKAVVYRVGWYNILPVLRQAPSPQGLLWYHNGRTVTRETLPPPARELRGVDGIVWPRSPDETDQLIVEAYGPYIERYFVPLDADDMATYWRRR